MSTNGQKTIIYKCNSSKYNGYKFQFKMLKLSFVTCPDRENNLTIIESVYNKNHSCFCLDTVDSAVMITMLCIIVVVPENL